MSEETCYSEEITHVDGVEDEESSKSPFLPRPFRYHLHRCERYYREAKAYKPSDNDDIKNPVGIAQEKRDDIEEPNEIEYTVEDDAVKV